MITRNQLDDGTIVTSGRQFISGAQAVKIAVTRQLKTALAECFLNQDVGVPYREVIFRNSSNVAREAAIKHVLLDTVGVQEILSFSLDLDRNRHLTCTARLLTNEGEVVPVVVDLSSATDVTYDARIQEQNIEPTLEYY